MAIPGTVPVTAPIAPTSDLDTYPSHIAEYGKGGYQSKPDIAGRNAIIDERRTSGMMVSVESDGLIYVLGPGLTNSDWTVFAPPASSNVLMLDTVTDLRAVSSSANNRLAFLLGNITAGDGGGGIHYWDNAATDADDPLIIIRPDDFTTNGLWKKLI